MLIVELEFVEFPLHLLWLPLRWLELFVPTLKLRRLPLSSRRNQTISSAEALSRHRRLLLRALLVITASNRNRRLLP